VDDGHSFAGPARLTLAGWALLDYVEDRSSRPSNKVGSGIQKRLTAANGRALLFYALCFCSK
jgi:hypothetical protein